MAVFLVIILGLLWQHFKRPSDRQIQRELTGTWVSSWGRGLTTTNVIAPDGSFASQVSGFANGGTIRNQGTLLATGGILVATATNDNQTVVMRWHIIRLDSHELVWSNDAGVTEPPFHKIAG